VVVSIYCLHKHSVEVVSNIFSLEGRIMKLSLPFILLATLLAGCAGISQQQSNSGEQRSTEAVGSKMPQAQPEVITVEPKEPDAVFPNIKPVYVKSNLWCIEDYCMKRGIQQLDRDCVRLFCQPMGFVSEAIEIDLRNRQLTVYPGTHSKKKTLQTPLDEGQIAEIRALVTSEEFKEIPRENKKFGLDGTWYLMEAFIDNVYSWKLHWVPEDKEFMKIVDYIQSLAREKTWKKTLQDKSVRLRNPHPSAIQI